MRTEVLSEGAREARKAYYRSRYKSAPEKHKVYLYRMWEKKARALYGRDYKPPESEDVLSDQAAEVRRRYYSEYSKTHSTGSRKAYMKEYRRKNRDKLTRYQKDYWERKAGNL